MQISLSQIAPDWFGVGDPPMGPAKVDFATSYVVPSKSASRMTYQPWDPVIVHVVAEIPPGRDRHGRDQVKAICGLYSWKNLMFQIHEKPMSFRSKRTWTYPGQSPLRRTTTPWFRLCSRCAHG